MKSIDLRHRLAAVLLAVCLVVCCALPAFATSANIVLGRLGSLHVRFFDDWFVSNQCSISNTFK